MIDPLDEWTNKIKALPPVNDAATGAKNFAQCIGELTNKVQAGSTGAVGILTFDQNTFALQLMSLAPGNAAWASIVAAAWQSAMMTSIVAPGTVMFPAWTASVVDVATPPIGAAAIPTIAAGFAALSTGLSQAGSYFQTQPTNSDEIMADHPEKMAQAFRDAILACSFNCIGIVAGEVPHPLPMIFPAQ